MFDSGGCYRLRPVRRKTNEFLFLYIPRTVSKLEFRLRQSPGVRATQRGPYCINTDLFAIDQTAGAYRLSPNSNFLTARGITVRGIPVWFLRFCARSLRSRSPPLQ